MNIVLLGAPGAGKGTLAQYLEYQYHIVQVSSGDLFRENIKNSTDLGRQAQAYMQHGQLVPDEITIAMIGQRLARIERGRDVLLDGFPRTVSQAQSLAEMLSRMSQRVDCVMYLDAPEDVLLHRLSGRWICRSCQHIYNSESRPSHHKGVCDGCGGELYQRDDDKPETARTRLAIFRASTEPLIKFYHRTGQLYELNGMLPIETVVYHAVSTLHLEAIPQAA